MSGFEIIGIISGIITVLDATTKVYSAATDVSGLPPAFRDVSKRIPLIQDTLRAAETRLNKCDQAEDFYKAMKFTLECCKDKAERLQKIFQTVTPRDGTPRFERYVQATRTLGKGNRVETLMKGILEDVQLLTGNHAVKAATEAQVKELQNALQEISAIPLSLPEDEPSSYTFYNSGEGRINVNTGGAPQNNNNSSGYQFNGPIHGFQLPFTLLPKCYEPAGHSRVI